MRAHALGGPAASAVDAIWRAAGVYGSAPTCNLILLVRTRGPERIPHGCSGVTAPGLLARLFTSDLSVINTLLVFCLLLYPLGMGLGILLARTRRAAHDLRLLRQAGQAVLLSVPFALLLGIAFRVMMRLVALAIGNEPSFSLGGTALIVLGFAFSGSLFTLLFFAARPWLPTRGLSKGLAFGMVLYVLFWHPFFRTASGDLRTVLDPVTIGLLTSLLMTLWIGYGLAVEATIGRLERRWPAASAGAAAYQPALAADDEPHHHISRLRVHACGSSRLKRMPLGRRILEQGPKLSEACY